MFLTIHGSQAFGMATELSDLDLKGVCVPPKSVREDLFHGFDQAENAPFVEDQFGRLRNPANPKMESTIYSLRKYVSLAALVNPTILELMWVDPKFVQIQHPAWNELVRHRKLFLSRKARQTYLGYAKQQVAKIERHRKWLKLEAAPVKPMREQFGLKNPDVAREFGESDRFIRRQIETWNFSEYDGIDEDRRHDIKELCWDLVFNLCQSAKTNWENWPDAYYQAALVKLQNVVQMPKDVLGLINAEKRYHDALKEWNGYQHWATERNAARKELEQKHGFDTKHACHLVRLLRQGIEVLETGELTVLRPDAAELLGIRNGAWSYERTVEYAAEMEAKLADAEKRSPLPQGVNKVAINAAYQSTMAVWNDVSLKLNGNDFEL
jgi:uncharacterized protein